MNRYITNGPGNYHIGIDTVTYYRKWNYLYGKAPYIFTVEAQKRESHIVGKEDIQVGGGGIHGDIRIIVPLKHQGIVPLWK